MLRHEAHAQGFRRLPAVDELDTTAVFGSGITVLSSSSTGGR